MNTYSRPVGLHSKLVLGNITPSWPVFRSTLRVLYHLPDTGYCAAGLSARFPCRLLLGSTTASRQALSLTISILRLYLRQVHSMTVGHPACHSGDALRNSCLVMCPLNVTAAGDNYLLS